MSSSDHSKLPHQNMTGTTTNRVVADRLMLGPESDPIGTELHYGQLTLAFFCGPR